MAKSSSVVRTDDQIEDLIEACYEAENDGVSKFPGMSYEQGVKAGIEWVCGDTDDHPLDD